MMRPTGQETNGSTRKDTVGNSCSAASDLLLRTKASASHRHNMVARTDQATADARVALAGRPGRGGSGTGEQEHGHPHQNHPEEIKPTTPGHNNDERPERAGDTEDEPFGRGHRPLEHVNPSASQFVNDEHGNDKGEQDPVHPRPTPERVTGHGDEPDCPEHHAAIPADARRFPYGCAHLPRLEFRGVPQGHPSGRCG
jgi:hypothetical protein